MGTVAICYSGIVLPADRPWLAQKHSRRLSCVHYLNIALHVFCCQDPYIRHYCRVHGVRLQHRLRISAARRNVAATAAATGAPNDSASEAASTTAAGTAGTKLR